MLEKNFCSSPWYHVRLGPDGGYRPCRWGKHELTASYTVANISITEFLQSTTMNTIRQTMLDGESPEVCATCQYEQSVGKVSGRQRQLLKSGIIETRFDKTFCSSPHWDQFEYSYLHQGQTQNTPVDLQIDLGNTCNSSCIMCIPKFSSRVAQEHQVLHKTNPVLFRDPGQVPNWTQDDKLVNKFVHELDELDRIKYIHFIGGETLYMKSFYNICNRMIETGQSNKAIIGTTTNCTVYDERIEYIICNFKSVHLGLSIEAITDLNDYIRWPSQIDQVKDNIKKFLALKQKYNIFISLRITPNVLSIYHLDQLFEFMLDNQLTAESCNILYEPSCLRMELLDDQLRQDIIRKLELLVTKYGLERPVDKIINRRIDANALNIISDLVFEYIDFLTNYTAPDNVEQERRRLVDFLKAYESIHNNKILNHLPEYEKFLRSNGY